MIYRICSCTFLCALLTSCSEIQKEPEDVAQRKTQIVQRVDTSDPMSVAEAFFTALVQKDADAALAQVLPEERADLGKQLEQEVPPIPAEFQLEMESITEKQKAQVQMLNAEFGLDLKYENGRWWVVK